MHNFIRTAGLLSAFAGLALNTACGAPGGGTTSTTNNSYTLPGLFVFYGSSTTVNVTQYDTGDALALTAAVVADLSAAIAFCDAIAQNEYSVDCLSERLSIVAAKLPDTGDFAEMRTVIADASAQLGAIAGQNTSAVLPTQVISSSGPTPVSTTRPLRPVATETLAANLAAADAIIARAEVTLLRSSSQSEERAISYQQVAAIVGRSRSLLRSA